MTHPTHDIIRQGDADVRDAPEQVKDRNGHIALNYCRRCGEYEAALDAPCALHGQNSFCDFLVNCWRVLMGRPLLGERTGRDDLSGGAS